MPKKKEAQPLCDTAMPHIQTHLDEELHKKLKHLSVTLGKSQGDLLKEAVAMLLTYYNPQGETSCQKNS
jgi:hypothetical protein